MPASPAGPNERTTKRLGPEPMVCMYDGNTPNATECTHMFPCDKTDSWFWGRKDGGPSVAGLTGGFGLGWFFPARDGVRDREESYVEPAGPPTLWQILTGRGR